MAFFPQSLNVNVFFLLIQELINLSEHLLNLLCGSFVKFLERKENNLVNSIWRGILIGLFKIQLKSTAICLKLSRMA